MKILLNLLLLYSCCSCTLYKSEGRKTFETQSPGQIRTLSLIGCNEIQNPRGSFDHSEWTPQGHEVRVSKQDQVINAEIDFITQTQKQSCTYPTENQNTWLSSRDYFFAELDDLMQASQLENLD